MSIQRADPTEGLPPGIPVDEVPDDADLRSVIAHRTHRNKDLITLAIKRGRLGFWRQGGNILVSEAEVVRVVPPMKAYRNGAAAETLRVDPEPTLRVEPTNGS